MPLKRDARQSAPATLRRSLKTKTAPGPPPTQGSSVDQDRPMIRLSGRYRILPKRTQAPNTKRHFDVGLYD